MGTNFSLAVAVASALSLAPFLGAPAQADSSAPAPTPAAPAAGSADWIQERLSRWGVPEELAFTLPLPLPASVTLLGQTFSLLEEPPLSLMGALQRLREQERGAPEQPPVSALRSAALLEGVAQSLVQAAPQLDRPALKFFLQRAALNIGFPDPAQLAPVQLRIAELRAEARAALRTRTFTLFQLRQVALQQLLTQARMLPAEVSAREGILRETEALLGQTDCHLRALGLAVEELRGVDAPGVSSVLVAWEDVRDSRSRELEEQPFTRAQIAALLAE